MRVAPTSLASVKNANGSSDDFFSFFFPCSRCSAAVKNEKLPDADTSMLPLFTVVFFLLDVLDLVLDFVSSSPSSEPSSVKSSSEEAEERPDETFLEEREDEDLTDFASMSESEGAMKSSSSTTDELDLDLPPVDPIERFSQDQYVIVQGTWQTPTRLSWRFLKLG